MNDDANQYRLHIDADDLRHPMWTKPGEHDDLPDHIKALQTEIAKRLIPYDGRTDHKEVIGFCQTAYFFSKLPKAHEDLPWLLGVIVLTSHRDQYAASVPVGSMTTRLVECLVAANKELGA